MKIPYGNKMYDVNNTYIFRIGRMVGHGVPKYIYAEYVHDNTITSVRKI